MSVNYSYLPSPIDVINASYKSGINFCVALQETPKTTIKELIRKVTDIFEKILNKSSQLSRALSITRNIVAPQTKFHSALTMVEGFIDVTQTLESMKFVATRDFTDISFGIANLANAALWLRQFNLEVLGGISSTIGSSTLEKISTGSLVLGHTGSAIQSYGEIKELEANKTKDEKISINQWKIACALGEIALIVLPMSAPVRTCTHILVKSVGIYVNLERGG